MLIAFILAQQRVTVERRKGERGGEVTEMAYSVIYLFALSPFVLDSLARSSRCFSLIIETVKLFSFAAQDVSGQKGCHG